MIVGGAGGSGNNWISLGDVWTSTDRAATWTQQDAPPFGERKAPQVALLGSDVIVAGGHGSASGGLYSDVWSSRDFGETWVLMLPTKETVS